jgi:cardiolipin synthase
LKFKKVTISRLALILMIASILILIAVIWSARRRRDVHFRVRAAGEITSMLPSIVSITQGALETGNSAEVLQNGDQFFPRLMADIAAAKHSVHFESYIWWKGKICDDLAKLLATKARQGVEVRLLVDASGGSRMTDENEELMEKAGVELRYFHPPRFSNLGRMNNRDHRKIMVIDGTIGYIGGFGIADEWTGNGQDRDHWRDTGLRMTGPVVGHLQGAFSENWIEETGEVPAGPRYFPKLQPTGNLTAHVAYTSPAGTATSVQLLHYLAIASAKRRIVIQNPYLLPDEATLDHLQEAVKRGVDVRIMVPSVDVNDSPIVQHASHHRYGPLLRRGVKLWEFNRTLLHQKTIVVDGIWSGIGSTNFDARSFELNDEITVGVLDTGTAAALERAFQDDLRDAKQQSLEQWHDRTVWHKVVDGLAYMLHEQL